MKFIKDYKEGDRVFDIYLCKHKQSAVTKNGKPYETVILQDKTGTVDGKIWDPNSAGIDDFDSLDYIEVYGAHPWRCEAVRLFCKILPDVKKGSAFGCRNVS